MGSAAADATAIEEEGGLHAPCGVPPDHERAGMVQPHAEARYEAMVVDVDPMRGLKIRYDASGPAPRLPDEWIHTHYEWSRSEPADVDWRRNADRACHHARAISGAPREEVGPAGTQPQTNHVVYLLRSQAGRHYYWGYSVDAVARLRCHNGQRAGGAQRTARHRPWELVLIVHGFRTKCYALQFEHALQNPSRSVAGARPAHTVHGQLALLALVQARPNFKDRMLTVHFVRDALADAACFRRKPAAYDTLQAEYVRHKPASWATRHSMTRAP